MSTCTSLSVTRIEIFVTLPIGTPRYLTADPTVNPCTDSLKKVCTVALFVKMSVMPRKKRIAIRSARPPITKSPILIF